VSKTIQSHRISKAEFLELKQETQQVFRNINDAIIRLTGRPFVDRFLDNDVSCVRSICNHVYESPNRKPVYEEKISSDEKVELPSEKQYVQPQSLVPTTVPVEEYPCNQRKNIWRNFYGRRRKLKVVS
jgi:hypothetical protein